MKEIRLQTSGRDDYVDLNGLVQAAVADLGLVNGAVVVFNPHTTAAVTINEGADPDVVVDMTRVLDRLIPWTDGYRHAEGNAAAHVKASLFGSSVHVPVVDGRLQLGTWQRIWFCEFDGPRTRKVWVQPLVDPGYSG